jgi:hypothetical protein
MSPSDGAFGDPVDDLAFGDRFRPYRVVDGGPPAVSRGTDR